FPLSASRRNLDGTQPSYLSTTRVEDRGREIEGPRIRNAACCPTRASVCIALKPDTRLEAREAGEGVRNTECQGSAASNPRALNWAGMDEFLVGGRPRSSQSGIIHFALSKSRSGGSQ